MTSAATTSVAEASLGRQQAACRRAMAACPQSLRSSWSDAAFVPSGTPSPLAACDAEHAPPHIVAMRKQTTPAKRRESTLGDEKPRQRRNPDLPCEAADRPRARGALLCPEMYDFGIHGTLSRLVPAESTKHRQERSRAKTHGVAPDPQWSWRWITATRSVTNEHRSG